ncbi:MAG: bifunctional helix-turn-helix transcriptional regulator/GNAT family N-acetyltransferase [Deltaproteobacteria bacterium]|nr:bifunctional helix-turn-helix transcriptional regulator/GNAT family N-acetyltransferase [Deltaproteobacteria bacterium]
MLPEVLPLRQASRVLVRELGFLQAKDLATSLSHSHCHALIELEARGALPQSELPGLLRLDKSTTSRVVAELARRKWIRARASEGDARVRILALTPAGREKVALVHREANARVEQALASLAESERQTVLSGMELYARALERSRRREAYRIRPIEARDREAVASLIRTVMPEFGAKGPGFAINDPEVDDMVTAYAAPRSGYFVVTRAAEKGRGDRVVGGGGFAPLEGGDKGTCELRKMYFLPEVRGLGLGQAVLDQCLAGAARARFRRMYLETLAQMAQARALYAKNGFVAIDRPLGSTGHFGCNRFMVRDLASAAKDG